MFFLIRYQSIVASRREINFARQFSRVSLVRRTKSTFAPQPFDVCLFGSKSSNSRRSSPLTGFESVLSRLALMPCFIGSRYEVGRDVLSSVMRFFESPTLRSRSSDFRRSLSLTGSDSVAFSTCSEASSLGSRSGIIAICTNSDGLHRIIYADWLKKSAPHFYMTYSKCDFIGHEFCSITRHLSDSALSDWSQVSKRTRRNNSVRWCVMRVAHHL